MSETKAIAGANTTAAARSSRSDSQTQLIVFGEDWGRHPSTAQYLAQQLLREHEITWINSIGLREPSLSKDDLNRVIGKLRRARQAPTTDAATATTETGRPDAPADPQHLVSPWVVPLHRYAPVRALNRQLFQRQVNGLAHLQGQTRRVITANPASYYLLDTLNPDSSLYYCADKYAQIAGLNPALVERFERALLERVDTVVATSLPLVEDLSAQHNNVHYLPHGVDYQRFSATLDLPQPEQSPAGPTVGFVGLLGEHIDFELIRASAAALPDVRFLFVGPVEQGIVLPEADNLDYRGAVPQQALPGYLAQMDVCTLPYAMTARNHYANPTKVREYLAAGRSVVATDQPGLVGIEGEVSISATADDYVAALKRRLADVAGWSSTQLTAERARIAASMANETWAARANQLAGWLAD